MKKLLALLMLVSVIETKAQITLEHTYPNGHPLTAMSDFVLVHFSANGYKYASSQQVGNGGVINLYNLNHSLFKSITVPNISGAQGPSVEYISDSLFNTTTSDIEYMLIYQDTLYGGHVRIYNDAGTLLFGADSIQLPSNTPTWPYTEPVVYTPNGYKMILYHSVYDTVQYTDTTVMVYSLPGALPCNACSSNGVLTGLAGPMSDGNPGYLSAPYPNPSSHSTSVNYQLPEGINSGQIIFYDLSGKEVKRFTVDKTFHTLELTTTDLAAGTYLYIMQTIQGRVGNRKMVVIR